MIGMILAQKILSLFIMMAMGAALVRTRLMKAEEGKSISIVALYLIVPCAIFSAFQVEYTDEIRNGLFLAAAAALILHIGMIGLTEILGKVMNLDAVEKASIIYSNSGNLLQRSPRWPRYMVRMLSIPVPLMW